MISLIPDAVLNLIYWVIILAGVSGILASWLARWVPFYGNYAKILKPVGIVLVVLGVYLKGGYDTEMAWRAKVDEAKSKVAEAEKASEDLNKKLEEEKKKKQKVRVEYYATVKTRIKEVEKQINAECKLDPTVNELVNKAAKNPEAKQ
jgi:multidrug efflux pump subunit AcrA (membrane-fusion protein)